MCVFYNTVMVRKVSLCPKGKGLPKGPQSLQFPVTLSTAPNDI